MPARSSRSFAASTAATFRKRSSNESRPGASCGAGLAPADCHEFAPDVMVIKAFGQENGLRAKALALVEPHGVVPEVERLIHISRSQMDVADIRQDVGVVVRLGNQRGQVEGTREHADPARFGVGPFSKRAVAVELDPVAFGVREVHGLGDAVVRRAVGKPGELRPFASPQRAREARSG